MEKIKISVFASGFGSTLEHVLNYAKQKDPKWSVVGLVCDNPNARALDIAKQHGLQHALVSRREFTELAKFDEAILSAVRGQKPDIIFLLGYLKMVGPDLVKDFRGRIFNTHPSLLPKHGGKGMFGHAVHDSVIRAGDLESGVTIHEVNDRYDEGQVLMQKRVPVDRSWSVDELENKIKAVEKDLIIEFLNSYCSSFQQR